MAEGQRSALPWVLLLVAIFFCAILTFIVTVNKGSDGDSHTKERVSLTYSFYDKFGNVRTEHYNKTYGKAPDFYEGQQIVVAFANDKAVALVEKVPLSKLIR